MRMKKLFVLVLATVMALTLAACASHDYDDFEHIRNWSEFDDISEQETGLFFLYIYLEGCPACREVKDDVFRFASGNKGNYSVYFIDGAEISGEAPIDTGRYVPALIAIQDGERVDHVDSVMGVRNVIDSVEDETYAP